MRAIYLGFIASLLTACGGYATQNVGIDESTVLIVRGESLVGLTLEIRPNFTMTISKSDLTEYTMGLAGAANKEVEDLETVTLMLDAGLQRIVISDAGKELIDRELHFTTGQTRELRVRR